MGEDDQGGMTYAEALADRRRLQSGMRTSGAILFAIGLAVAYWVWPTGITDLPIASVPFGSFLRVIGAVAVTGAFAFLALLLAWD